MRRGGGRREGGDDGGSSGVGVGVVGGRGRPYGSSTNVLNYKSEGERVDCQVGLQAGSSLLEAQRLHNPAPHGEE